MLSQHIAMLCSHSFCCMNLIIVKLFSALGHASGLRRLLAPPALQLVVSLVPGTIARYGTAHSTTPLRELCVKSHWLLRISLPLQGGDSAPSSRNTGAAVSQSGGASKAINVLLPLLLILAAVLVNMYLKKE
jgi:hypothetical protein